MARQYGKDTDSAKIASEEVDEIRKGDVELQHNIEKGIGIGCVALAVIILIVNIVNAVSLGADSRRLRESFEYEQSKLSTTPEPSGTDTEPVEPSTVVGADTVRQEYRVSNMKAAGQALADEQNRLIEEVRSGSITAYKKSDMSPDVISTYMSGDLSNSKKRLWCWDVVAADTNVDYEWVFSSDYDFENSYAEGGAVQDKSTINQVVGVWRLYEKTDAASQKKLLMYVTGIYHCGSLQGAADGYFTDIEIVGLTGWGEQKVEEPVDSTVFVPTEGNDRGAPAENPDNNTTIATPAPANEECGEPDYEPSESSESLTSEASDVTTSTDEEISVSEESEVD